MTDLSDDALVEFVATSAAILGLQLDDEALAAVRDAMRGVLKQASLVLEEPQPPDGTFATGHRARLAGGLTWHTPLR